MKTNIHFLSCLAHFFLEWEIFRTSFVKKMKTQILCSVIFFENRIGYEIMWKNIVECRRPRMTIWCLHIACWIPKATNTHWLFNTHCFSTASMVTRTPSLLRKLCIACLVWINGWQHVPNCVLHLLLKGKRTPLQFAVRRSRSSRWKQLCGLCHNIAFVAVRDYYGLAFKKWQLIILVHLLI
jgi:hypothetical protein